MISPSNNDSAPTGILVAYSVCQAESRNVPIHVIDSSNIDLQLQIGQKIRVFSPLLESIVSYPG